MSSHTFRKHLTSIAAAIVILPGIAILSQVQGYSAESKQQLKREIPIG